LRPGELNILVITLARLQKALKCSREDLLRNAKQDQDSYRPG